MNGVFNLGPVGLSRPSSKGAVRIFSDNPGTRLIYSGASAAVSLGDSGAFIEDMVFERIGINIAGAAPTAIGLLGTRLFAFDLNRVRVETTKGLGAVNGQIGVKLDGGPAGDFSAYTLVTLPRIMGDFSNGLLVTAGSPACDNSSQIIGGAIGGTTQNQAPGGIGVKIENADTWLAIGTDLEGWDCGLDINSSNNTDLRFRYENCRTKWRNRGNNTIAQLVPMPPNG